MKLTFKLAAAVIYVLILDIICDRKLIILSFSRGIRGMFNPQPHWFHEFLDVENSLYCN